MTTTEAIRHLGALSAFANADEVKAVEMAIKKLSEGPSIADLIADANLDFSRPRFIAKRDGDTPLWADHPVFNQKPPRITRNAIECGKCGDVIESKHPHDYKMCRCQGCSVDGGLERLNRSGEDFFEMSEWA